MHLSSKNETKIVKVTHSANSMEEEGEKWSGIELIVVAKKFEANLIKVRDRRWSSKLR